MRRYVRPARLRFTHFKAEACLKAAFLDNDLGFAIYDNEYYHRYEVGAQGLF